MPDSPTDKPVTATSEVLEPETVAERASDAEPVSHPKPAAAATEQPAAAPPVVALGMVGLGRMGANLAIRAMNGGHHVLGFDPNPDAAKDLIGAGGQSMATLEDLVKALPRPRAVWVMVPAGVITDKVVDQLTDLLEAGDCLIDGGNSYYRDDMRRSAVLAAKDVDYLDVGTSGGIWGRERGYCLMIGGQDRAVERLTPLWNTLAPGVDSAERTPGRTGEPSPAERGWLHCGPSGAGHFVKMVHNGIEYGLMAAYAEGLNVLRHANAGLHQRDADAETAPLAEPQYYQYELDLPEIAEVWRRGSVIGSWLLDLTALALNRSPQLDEFGGRVSDSGEGRWTSIAAIEEGVPIPVLAASLFERFESQGRGLFAGKILSALRKEFGGHDEKPPGADAQPKDIEQGAVEPPITTT